MATEDNIVGTLIRSTREDMTSMVGFSLVNPTSTLWFVHHGRPEFGSVNLDSLVQERFKFMHIGAYSSIWELSSSDMDYEAYYSASSIGGDLAFPVTSLGIDFKLRSFSYDDRGDMEIGRVYEVSGEEVRCSTDSVCDGLIWRKESPIEYSLYFRPNPTNSPRYYRMYVYVADNGYYRHEGRIRERLENRVYVGKRWPVAILEFLQYADKIYGEETLADIRRKYSARLSKFVGYDDGYENIQDE